MLSTAATASGVKNLRAMFETRTSDTNSSNNSSPPSRGRSPNGSTISASSVRPLSKVRTSFVAVERPGEAGQISQVGLVYRRASNVSKTSSMAEVKEDAVAVNGVGAGHGLGDILKGSAFENAPDRPVQSKDVKEEVGADPQAVPDKKTEAPRTNGVKQESMLETQVEQKQAERAAEPQMDGTAESKPAKTVPARIDTSTKPSSASKKNGSSIPKASPSMVKKTPVSATSEKSPATPALRIRGGPAKIQAVLNSARAARESSAKTESAKNDEELEASTKDSKLNKAGPPSFATKGTAASRSRSTQDKQKEETTQVKSPTTTRAPARLPSAATAGTAASAAHRKTVAQQEETTKPGPRQTTIPRAPRVADVSTKAAQARKTPRASLAPSEANSERPRSRQAHAPRTDGSSFLDRLTRPTASSSGRTYDKPAKADSISPPQSRRTSGAHVLNTKKSTRQSIGPTATRPGAAGITGEKSLLDPVSESSSERGAVAAPERDHIEERASIDDVDGAHDDEGEPGPEINGDEPMSQDVDDAAEKDLVRQRQEIEPESY